MPSAVNARTLDADPTGTLPCMADPAGWEIRLAEDRFELLLIRRQVRAALDWCSTCPALDWCKANAHRNPPEHNCVQGGEIWPGTTGHRGGASAARRRAARPVPYVRWKPRMVPSNSRAEVTV